MSCELCPVEHRTRWYHTGDDFAVVDCVRCGVPMVVVFYHTAFPPMRVLGEALRTLRHVAAKQLGDYWIDRRRRSIPGHWHAHARPQHDR